MTNTTVLVVDDHRDAALALRMLLELAGYDVLVAHDGEEALRLAQKHEPSVVLLDIVLPRMSGVELCERIRKLPWGRRALVIAMTGWYAKGRFEDPNSNFDRWLLKPVASRQLEELIHQHLAELPSRSQREG